ncbi:hypothetical protein KIK06_23495 [Nocardiopsis sp. EMB25]|uniref:hypothetical protein n=1 Tax=Nocardiopsis sp. EMB25 TaxID=2835867 RepID=UPI00228518B3|nr:hypothetical protein [Nocardiopsis sp. EMB25]MCY9786852.1 hypothetical protein [Nocardiopsis sp. EMB25]
MNDRAARRVADRINDLADRFDEGVAQLLAQLDTAALSEFYVNRDDGYSWLYHRPTPDEEGHLVRLIRAGDTLAAMIRAAAAHHCEPST